MVVMAPTTEEVTFREDLVIGCFHCIISLIRMASSNAINDQIVSNSETKVGIVRECSLDMYIIAH